MDNFILRINESYTPKTIPLSRIAEYMLEYAKLLGEQEHVHFGNISEGSIHMEAFVDSPSIPAVRQRLDALNKSNTPEDILKAFLKLDEMLSKDNATGLIVDGNGEPIVNFIGKNKPKAMVFGPITQHGSIEGEIIRIGGADTTIHLHIRDGDKIYTKCTASKALSREMAQYLFGSTVRAQGVGKWIRNGDGAWELLSFKIQSFEVLEDTSLIEIVSELRSIPGNNWGKVSATEITDVIGRGDGEPS